MIGRSQSGRSVALACLAALVSSACSSITEPDPRFTDSCEPPASLLLDSEPSPFGLGELQDAVAEASTWLAPALGESDDVASLTRALEGIAAQSGATGLDTACRFLIVASNSMAALPDDPATAPDRDSIQFLLVLIAGAIDAERP